MVYFFDSSAVVKRYVGELGSPWVNHILDPAQRNRIYLARVSAVEVVAALARRGRASPRLVSHIASAVQQFRQTLVLGLSVP